MMISIFAYSRQGMRTARQVMSYFKDHEINAFAPERMAEAPFLPINAPSAETYGKMFASSDAMIFVSACGIAVRSIAPHIRSKQTDPAVLCMDESGKYVIPILSGHIGGANDLAEKLAVFLHAEAVITTATDINGRFSVDSWAARNGYHIHNMNMAKEISAAILEQDIPVYSMLPVRGNLPEGLFPAEEGPAGIFIGWEIREPFGKTLRLIPSVLHVGIGCRRGTPADSIRQAVFSVLKTNRIDRKAVKCAASIDLKSNETGLLEFCSEENIPLQFYSAEELMRIPGDFTGSEFVEKITGADNVCERAAMMNAEQLIAAKTVRNGVTVAIAAERKEVCFE